MSRVQTAYPGAPEGADRAWAVLLDCGQQAKVYGRRGARPKRGDHVRCRACIRQAQPERVKGAGSNPC